MKKVRYSEIFYSIQGEGKYVGAPSVFLRTFGCNFRCQNFGLDRDRPKDKYNPEVAELIASDTYKNAKSLDDLPIIHTGCDTYASIYTDFKHLMHDKTVDELVDELLAVIPNGDWVTDNGQHIHLIITGGEPLLGWQKFYIDLLAHPKLRSLVHITFETNGTQKLRPDFVEALAPFNVTFSCSPKLSMSGESREVAIQPEILETYHRVATDDMYLKFVVANRDDIDEVDSVMQQIGKPYKVFLMPLGGRSEEYELNTPEVAKMAMERGYSFSPRLHVTLFGNNWAT